MTDTKIIDLYWSRQESAIVESNLKYGSYCRTIALNILNQEEDAEECVSDTWMRSWEEIPPARPQKLRYFFAKITRNLALDRYRAKHAQKRGNGEITLVFDELQECITNPDTVENAVMAKELGQQINLFLKTLPQREATLFVRRYFFAEPIQAIAKKQGISVNNASVLLSRVRQKLKKHLAQEGYEL